MKINRLYNSPQSLGYTLNSYLIYEIDEDNVKYFDITISSPRSKVGIQKRIKKIDEIDSIFYNSGGSGKGELKESSPSSYYYIIDKIFTQGVF